MNKGASGAHLLGAVPLFESLTEPELQTISSHAIRRSFPKNTTIIHEGDETDSLYIIEQGKAKAFLTNRMGREIVLSLIQEGSCFGEIALLDSAPRSASVMTTAPSTLLVITRKDFEQCLADNIHIATNIIRTLTERVRELTDNIKNLALSDVYSRMVSTLYKLAEEQGEVFVVNEKLTQQDIANMVGASREMVNKIMHDLVKGGYITTKNRQIIIHKKLPSGW